MSSLFKHREITYSIYSPSIYSTFHDPSLKLYGNDACKRSFGSFDQRYDSVFNVATIGQSRGEFPFCLASIDQWRRLTCRCAEGSLSRVFLIHNAIGQIRKFTRSKNRRIFRENESIFRMVQISIYILDFKLNSKFETVFN